MGGWAIVSYQNGHPAWVFAVPLPPKVLGALKVKPRKPQRPRCPSRSRRGLGASWPGTPVPPLVSCVAQVLFPLRGMGTILKRYLGSEGV